MKALSKVKTVESEQIFYQAKVKCPLCGHVMTSWLEWGYTVQQCDDAADGGCDKFFVVELSLSPSTTSYPVSPDGINSEGEIKSGL